MDRFFRGKDLEELTRKTYDNMGLEVRDVLAKSDLYERAGKNQHGFCLSVGREYPYDVRVLVNVRPDSYWMDTTGSMRLSSIRHRLLKNSSLSAAPLWIFFRLL